ncbi:ABC transporter permease [Humisphaera borealis]|uniref:ABC transporter permease n=1 Tax=Humisphaera borealis TaxID=2807512 RepID=A0A7M2WYD3_9BACT|nr:ABC transporter permease [Humisphaera borealis]QOV90508.1 ABC transporter permease [Humisphaera borealis]
MSAAIAGSGKLAALWRSGARERGMFSAFALMFIVLWLSNPSFVSQDNLVNTSRQIAMLAVFATGIAFVIITGGIDLSVGSVIGLTGVIIAKISAPTNYGGLNFDLWTGIPVALAVALLVGLAQGLLITRLNLQPFIVTLGGMLVLKGVSQTIVEGKSIYLGLAGFRDFVRQGLFEINGAPVIVWPIVIMIGVLVVAAYVLHFSVYGRYLFAIGGNRDAASYSGIPVKRVECSTYVISAFLAGVAGVMYAAYQGEMKHTVGEGDELQAIAAVVLGGVSLRGGEGTVIGVLIGSAIMRIIVNGIEMFRIGDWRPDENWKMIIIGSVILIAVILDQLVHIVQARRRTRRAAIATSG